jgi:hypothetical protein
MLLQYLFVRDRMLWTPSIVPENGDPQDFSEDRAMRHVEVLTEVIGDHQVISAINFFYVYLCLSKCTHCC